MTSRFVSQPHLASVQLARAIAAIAVMLGHVGSEFGPLGLADPLPSFNEGAAGVDLFFVVSGFVIALSSEKLIGGDHPSQVFFARRVARIVPLWWGATAAMLLAYLAIYPTLAEVGLSWPGVVATLFFYPHQRPSGSFYPVIPQGWTLLFEMLFYLIFALALATRRKMEHVVAIASVAILAIMAAFYLGIAAGPLRFWANPIVLEFVFGMGVYLLYRRGYRLPAIVALPLVTVSLFLLFRPGSVNGGWVTFGRQIEWGLPATMAVAGLAMGRWPTAPRWLSGPVVLLGDASYALYLTHAMVFWLIRAHFGPAMDAASHPHLFVFTLLASAVAASIAIFLLFEQPMTRILQQRIAGWRGIPRRPVTREWRHLAYGATVLAGTFGVLAVLPPLDPMVRSVRYQEAGQASEEPNAAIEAFTRAIALTPSNPALFFLRGSAFLKVDQPQAAANDFIAGLDLDPNNVTLKFLLDQALARGAVAASASAPRDQKLRMQQH